MCQDISAHHDTGTTLHNHGSIPFTSLKHALGNQWIRGIFCSVIKRPEREAYHHTQPYFLLPHVCKFIYLIICCSFNVAL
jgi:hypothetical protein